MLMLDYCRTVIGGLNQVVTATNDRSNRYWTTVTQSWIEVNFSKLAPPSLTSSSTSTLSFTHFQELVYDSVVIRNKPAWNIYRYTYAMNRDVVTYATRKQFSATNKIYIHKVAVTCTWKMGRWLTWLKFEQLEIVKLEQHVFA